MDSKLTIQMTPTQLRDSARSSMIRHIMEQIRTLDVNVLAFEHYIAPSTSRDDEQKHEIVSQGMRRGQMKALNALGELL